jgi:esterase/lipase
MRIATTAGDRRPGMAGRLAAFGFAAVGALALGPRNTAEADAAPLPPAALPTSPAALPAHLAALEARHVGITPGTEKAVRFSRRGNVRSAWAVVYLHGFSATRQETAPLADLVADVLDAHVFATRLTGHGQDGAALAGASVAAWKADALEALAIGRLLGERVLVVGVSTGAALAAWLAQQPQAQHDTAWVLVSPNFGLRERSSEIINWPWGRALARVVAGAEHGFEPRNAQQARYWTTRYPIEALYPLMATVHLARSLPLDQWQMPVLMLLAPEDKVIDPAAARAAFARLGTKDKRLVEVLDSTDALQHVIAGRILSPGNTDRLARLVADWAASLPPPSRK